MPHVCSDTVLRQAHVITKYLYANCIDYDVATRKTISIRDDQEEWIQENHMSLSSFVQAKLDEHIEDRS